MTSIESYKKYCEAHPEISIFLSWKWISYFCDDFKVFEISIDNKIAYLILPIEKKLGFTIIRNPLLSPYCGFLFDNGFDENKKNLAINSLLAQLPKCDEMHLDFHPDYFVDKYEMAHKLTSKITYKLKLDVEDKIYANFKDALKRQIKKGEKNLIIESTKDVKLLYNLYLKSQSKQQNKLLISYDELKKIVDWGFEENCMRIDIIKNEQDNYIAASLLCFDNSTSYYLLGGQDPLFSNSGAMSFLLWQQIRISIAMQKIYFDFEGSIIPSIAKFFSNYGATLYNYNSLQKNASGLLSILKKVKNIL